VNQVILSHFQAQQLLKARIEDLPSTNTSIDLGLTDACANLAADGITIGAETQLSWQQIEMIAASTNACFILEQGELFKVQSFSSTTNRLCSLIPTQSAPALMVAGFPMHRIKDTNPHLDSLAKVRSVRPVYGHVLDTTTGLGYTAIEASHTAKSVVTVEIDPTVLDIARKNPWSRMLFDNPRIAQRLGDITELIAGFENNSFSRIIHDPPTFSLAGELYSGSLYAQLYRVLASGGRLFHYLGDPGSKLGHQVTRGAVERLRRTGFGSVRPYPQAFGVVAQK
jgi:predicted methyltransferase